MTKALQAVEAYAIKVSMQRNLPPAAIDVQRNVSKSSSSAATLTEKVQFDVSDLVKSGSKQIDSSLDLLESATLPSQAVRRSIEELFQMVDRSQQRVEGHFDQLSLRRNIWRGTSLVCRVWMLPPETTSLDYPCRPAAVF